MKIEARGVGRGFGKKQALSNVYFECHAGEIVAIVGDNGAGKTTLLQTLAGLVVPTRGQIQIDGEILNGRSESFRRRLAIVPDFPPYFSDRSVLQHLAMLCRLYGVEAEGLESRAVGLMEEIGILELGKVPMSSLSRGEVYKTVLVGFLLANPELWLLDEPMASGMDPRGLNFLQKHLRACCAAGASVLYSTQIPEVAEKFSDRIFVLQKGSLIAQEPAAALMARTGRATLSDALVALREENTDS